MKILRRLAICLLAIFPSSIWAVADIELVSIRNLENSDFAPPRPTIQIAMTYSNNGPDPAAFAFVGSQYFISRLLAHNISFPVGLEPLPCLQMRAPLLVLKISTSLSLG